MSKIFLAFLLFPTAAVSAFSSLRLFYPVAAGYKASFPFLAGFLAYPAFQALFFKPQRLYVFGHELTHAVAGLLSGARIHGFSVKANGGHVKLSHSNVLIALAPYFIPIYSVILILAYRLASIWAELSPYDDYFLVLMGATLSFHLFFTLDALWQQKQPDLEQAGGVLFSLVMIALANSLCLAVLFKMLFPSLISLRAFGQDVFASTLQFWQWSAANLYHLLQLLLAEIGKFYQNARGNPA